MPLRDHFHPPLKKRRSWDELHGGWPMKIVESLLPQLPPEYTAAPRIHLGGAVEIDAGTYEQFEHGESALSSSGQGGVATATLATATWTATEPTFSVETDIPDVDEYEVRVYDAERERRLVAAVELVSPANKDRPETRNAFVVKCAALLQQHVSVTIVDVVTSRQFNLYAELLAMLKQKDAPVPDPESIYAVTCRWIMPRNRWVRQAWHRPLVVGQPLPTLPLWLADDLAIALDLEASYEETCRVLRIA